jgi:hypothetical protein
LHNSCFVLSAVILVNVSEFFSVALGHRSCYSSCVIHVLSPWPSCRRDLGVPPLAVIEPFIEPPGPGGHRLWNGATAAHPDATWNRWREAVYRWPAVSPSEVILGERVVVPRGAYPVVRVLCYHLQGATLPRTYIVNTCGVVACVNIEHWHVVTPEECKAWRKDHLETAFESYTWVRHW